MCHRARTNCFGLPPGLVAYQWIERAPLSDQRSILRRRSGVLREKEEIVPSSLLTHLTTSLQASPSGNEEAAVNETLPRIERLTCLPLTLNSVSWAGDHVRGCRTLAVSTRLIGSKTLICPITVGCPMIRWPDGSQSQPTRTSAPWAGYIPHQ